jgi:hypothetical protein
MEKPAADEKDAAGKDGKDTGISEKDAKAEDAKKPVKVKEKAAPAKKTPVKGKE